MVAFSVPFRPLVKSRIVLPSLGKHGISERFCAFGILGSSPTTGTNCKYLEFSRLQERDRRLPVKVPVKL
jgi:hypothetical protein